MDFLITDFFDPPKHKKYKMEFQSQQKVQNSHKYHLLNEQILDLNHNIP